MSDLELAKDETQPWAHHMTNNIPCFTCSFDGLQIDPKTKTMQCGACRYAHFCDQNCQRKSWGHHKNFCPHMKKHQTSLLQIYEDSGLFTNGEKWRTITCYGSQKLAAYVRIMNRIRLAREGFLKLPKELKRLPPGCVHQIDVFKPERFYTNLDQRGTVFHDWIYGLVHPTGAAKLGAWLRQAGVTRLVDPLARNGALLRIMHIFGGFGEECLTGSDIGPTWPSVWDVEAKDALQRSTYPENIQDIAVVLSWPDPPMEKDPVGPKLVKLYTEWGVRILIVLRDQLKKAVSPECDFSAYKKVYALTEFNIGDTWPKDTPPGLPRQVYHTASICRHSTQITEVFRLRQTSLQRPDDH